MAAKKPTRSATHRVVGVADKRSIRNLKRVISHALASGLRNVMKFSVELTGDHLTGQYYVVTVTIVDKFSKEKWR